MRKAIMVILGFVFLILVGCLWMYPSDMPIAGVELPFAVHQEGAVAETNLRIIEYRSYRFALLFYYMDREDRKRIERLVAEINLDKYRKARIHIPLTLKIVSIDDANKESSAVIRVESKEDAIIYGIDKTMEARKTTAGGSSGVEQRYGARGYYNRVIAGVDLKPGLYKITVKSIKNIPELAGIPISFAISYNPQTPKINK